MQIKKPDLSKYDIVIVVEGGRVIHVAPTRWKPLDVLIIDRDVPETSGLLRDLPPDHPAQDEAAKLIQELADEVEKLPPTLIDYAEQSFEVEEHLADQEKGGTDHV